MATAFSFPKCALLLIFYIISIAAMDKRFSDLKICADKECSMLLVRGKMIADFSGPDCRFLSAKKSENVYVYYKLGGRRSDMWAGSVGRQFGYFPNELLEVNYVYTETEIVLPTEETDFVCFDTGYSGYDNYDIDSLLSSSIKHDGDNEDTVDQPETADGAEILSEPTVGPTETVDDDDDGRHDDDGGGHDASHKTEEPNTPSPLPALTMESDSHEAVERDVAETQADRSAAHEPTTAEDATLEKAELEHLEATGEQTDDRKVEAVPRQDPSAADGPTETLAALDEVTTDDEETDMASPHDEAMVKPVTQKDAEAGVGSTSPSTQRDPELQMTSQATPSNATTDDEDEEYDDDEEEEKEKEDASMGAVPHDEATLKSVPKNDPEAGVGSTLTPSKATTDDEEDVSMGAVPHDEATLEPVSKNDSVATTDDEEDTVNVIPVDEAKTEEPIKDADDNLKKPTDTPLPPFSNKRTRVLERDPPDEGPHQTPKADNSNDGDEDEEEEEEEDDDDDDDDDDVPSTAKGWSSLGDKVFAIVSGGKRTPDVLRSKEVTDKAERLTVNGLPAAEPEGEEDRPDEDSLVFLEADADELHNEPAPLSFDHKRDDDEPRGAVGRAADQRPTGENPLEISAAGDPDAADPPADPSPPQPSPSSSEEEEEADAREEPAERRTSERPDIGDEEEEDVDEDDGEDMYGHAGRDGDTSAHAAEVARDAEDETVTRREDVDADAKERENATETRDEGEDHVALERDSGNPATENNATRDTEADHHHHHHHHEGQADHEEELSSKDEEELSSKDEEQEEEEEPERGELLEDENALSRSESAEDEPPPPPPAPAPEPEPEYSDDVLRLTLLRAHFKDEDMQRLRRFLSLGDLVKAEALYADLDLELQAARLNDVSPAEDVEKSLDGILEASENAILDEIERMLDGRDPRRLAGEPEDGDAGRFDEEAELLDEFQELGFKLRQKYSAAGDSAPLADAREPPPDRDDHTSHDTEVSEEVPPPPPPAVTAHQDDIPTEQNNGSVVVAAGAEDALPELPEGGGGGGGERGELAEPHKGPDLGVEADGGRFNRNEDNQPSYGAAEDMQKLPAAVFEKPLDLGLGVETEHSAGTLEVVGDLPEEEEKGEEMGLFSSGLFYGCCLLSMIKTRMTNWVIVLRKFSLIYRLNIMTWTFSQ